MRWECWTTEWGKYERQGMRGEKIMNYKGKNNRENSKMRRRDDYYGLIWIWKERKGG